MKLYIVILAFINGWVCKPKILGVFSNEIEANRCQLKYKYLERELPGSTVSVNDCEYFQKYPEADFIKPVEYVGYAEGWDD